MARYCTRQVSNARKNVHFSWSTSMRLLTSNLMARYCTREVSNARRNVHSSWSTSMRLLTSLVLSPLGALLKVLLHSLVLTPLETFSTIVACLSCRVIL